MRNFFVIIALFSSFLFIVTPVFAQIQARTLEEGNCLALKADGGLIADRVATLDCIPIIIGNVVFYLLVFAGIVALILIIISGFKFVTSAGEPKRAEGARKTLTFALIGLFLILLSFAIVRFVADVTGVGCITKFGLTQCVPKDLSQPCSNTNPFGFCEGGRECLSRSGRVGYSCQFRCSNDNRTGWCPGNQECTRIEANYWSCRRP